jgi:hypothetical protein
MLAPARFASFIPRRLAALALGAASAVFPSGSASAGQVSELPSVLVIAKSSNKNEVHYAARVDEACAPAGPSPVRPYWLMLERGPLVTEPLSDSEQRVLGIEHQDVAGDRVEIALRGMPARAIVVRTWRAADGRCASMAETTIAGVRARLASVYVQQTLFGVDYVVFTGWTDDGATVRERVSP